MAASAASCDLSTGSSVYDTSEEKTNGLRLVRLLVEGGTAILRKFLYFVYPPENLQVVLNKNEAKLQRLKSKGVIFAIQWEMLFPPSGDPPNAEVFDITLLHLLLRKICYLAAPSTGWHEMPPHDDDSPEANIIRIKCYSPSTPLMKIDKILSTFFWPTPKEGRMKTLLSWTPVKSFSPVFPRN